MKLCHSNRIKELNNLAIPLILQSISGLLIGLIDTAMTGRISTEAFAAVGVISEMLFAIAGVLGFISVSFNILGGGFLGKKDEEGFRTHFSATMILNSIIGGIFFLVIIFFSRGILRGFWGFEGEVFIEAQRYIGIMSLYMVVQLMLFTFSTFFKMKRRTKVIFIGSLGASIMNIILDYLLIFGKLGFPRLGVVGAALATIISLSSNLLFYIWMSRDSIYMSMEKIPEYWNCMISNIKTSVPLMGQELLDENLFATLVPLVIARIGTIEVAAYIIIKKLTEIILIPMHMYGNSALTLVSQSSGEGSKDDMISIPKVGTMVSLGVFVSLGAVLLIFRGDAPRILTDDKELIEFAGGLLVIGVISVIMRIPSTIYKSCLQAVGDSMWVLIRSAKINLCIIGIMFGGVYLMNIEMRGIYIILGAGYSTMTFVLVKRYRKSIKKEGYIKSEIR